MSTNEPEQQAQTVSRTLSPVYSLICGHIFLVVIVVTFYLFGFYQNSSYFQWGPPVYYFDSEINSTTTFYLLLALIFVHQLISNWIYEVVVPWIIVNIQTTTSGELPYSKPVCLGIVNFNSLYQQLHFAFIISGITSQISFLVAIILADFVTLSYINWHYLQNKTEPNIPPMASPSIVPSASPNIVPSASPSLSSASIEVVTMP